MGNLYRGLSNRLLPFAGARDPALHPRRQGVPDAAADAGPVGAIPLLRREDRHDDARGKSSVGTADRCDTIGIFHIGFETGLLGTGGFFSGIL